MTASPRLPLARWAAVVLPGVVLYFTPVAGLEPGPRHLLALFTALIVSFMVRPAPMGVSALVVLALAGVTGTLPPNRIFAGFANPIVWLVVSAFLFAHAVTRTKLGLRVAYFFIGRFARTPLMLGYSVVITDLVLAPFVPSDTARGGAIVSPVVRGLASALGSEPGRTANRIGSYLTLVGFHGTYLSSAMFLTGMAANPLIAEFAGRIAGVDLSWGRWALAACVPGLCSMALMPWLLYHFVTPDLRETENARRLARRQLAEMGPMSREQKRLVVIMALVVAGWITTPWHGINNTVIALLGVCALLLSGVLRWPDLLADSRAWDAVSWFAPLLVLAEALNDQGVVAALFTPIFAHLTRWPWPIAVAALAALYLYAHYGFASMTAHVSALFPTFLAAALTTAAPPLAAVLPLAFFSNLNAGLTHYGTGSAPVYFSLGYVSQNTWWTVGFIVSLVNVAIWLGVGTVWWQAIGLW
ncbi:MAG TPA: DASS family sodium-coupled anion symporter [Opitutaceae bacterium]|nr:DASS family sodium-coupled anion symporter [Opitutaceae bacterium]